MLVSARTRNDSEIFKSSALAVLRFITSSNFIGCSIGRSAGLLPCRILCTIGSKFTVTLNGEKTVDGAQDAKFASGRIALQHGLGVGGNDTGVVKFRKIEIKPL
jgi:hypothetical protein